MKKCLFFTWLLALSLLAASEPEIKLDPMPVPLTNNAVAGINDQGPQMFSFMGIGAKKTWDAVTTDTYALDLGTGKWRQARPVPGTAGRLGASAVSARDHVFLFGGYVLDSRGGETTVPDVNVYQPASDRWYRGADIPVPVSASVAGVYRDRYIYLVSGWAKGGGAVNNVQVYNAEKNEWKQATPIPGTPVFGHAGGVVNDTIVYVDGAMKNPGDGTSYIASDECWMGKIDHHDPSKIQWTKLPAHPGPARFRIATGVSEKDDKIYFAGGSPTPYTTVGKTFDGNSAEPSAVVFAFDERAGKWETIDENTPAPGMDQRGLLVGRKFLILAGGMKAGGEVTAEVKLLPKEKETKKK